MSSDAVEVISGDVKTPVDAQDDSKMLVSAIVFNDEMLVSSW